MSETRGRLALDADKCTSCMLCVRECPSWCIELTSRTDVDEASAPIGGRNVRSTHVLQSFDVDYGLCMFCGVCVQVCPFDALAWEDDQAPSGPRTGLKVSLMPQR